MADTPPNAPEVRNNEAERRFEIVIGDQIVRGYVPYDGMKAIISGARKGTKTE